MAFNRVQQWTTFARVWYLFDAKWQDPNVAGQMISRYLMGKHKPIYSKQTDCGDYVVVINSQEIALKNDLWRTQNFFRHTGYAKGARYTPAWEFHEKDPKKIIHLCTKNEVPNSMTKGLVMSRLIVFPDNKIPSSIIANVSEQLRSLRTVPKPLQNYTQEEIDQFPRLFEWPKDLVIDDLKGAYAKESVQVQIKN